MNTKTKMVNISLRDSLMFLMCFLFGCSGDNSYEISDKQKLVNSIRYQVAKKLKKEKNLYPFGSGGQMRHQVRSLYLGFKYYEPLDITQGRKLVIEAATEFVAQINAKEELRQYLYRYPFQLEDVEVDIYVEHRDVSPFAAGDIEIVGIKNKLLKFKTTDPRDESLLTIHHETIEEALSRIANPPAEPLELKPLPRVELPKPGDKNLRIGFCE